MSFLNNILSSIGDGTTPATTRSPANAGRSAQLPPIRRSATGNSVTKDNPAKRKAEGEPENDRTKAIKREQAPVSRPPNPAVRRPATSPIAKSQSSSGAASVPYRGTANTSVQSSAASKPPVKPVSTVKPMPGSKPAPKPGTAAPPVTSKPALTSRPSATASSTAAPAAAPKKGSYAEMLARAKAAQQQKATTVGTIQHKPVQKLTKKERLAQEAAAKAKPGKNLKTPVQNGRSKSAEVANAKGVEPVKEKKKVADLGYQGTMRPKPKEPEYQGTMRAGPQKPGMYDRSRSTSLSAKPRGRYAGYRSYDESEDDEDEQEDYGSDVSSDMEAGYTDVEEEEQLALKVAKKEDLEALKEEDRLRREKQERLKKLQQGKAAQAERRRFM